MKVIGNYSLRGQVRSTLWNSPIELMLDYGDMNVVSVPIAQSWFWGDNREIAWAQSTVAAAGRRSMNGLPFNGIIDGDNLVVGDLFLIIESDSTSETSVNYKIELEKLKVAPEVTIMTLVNQVDQSD